MTGKRKPSEKKLEILFRWWVGSEENAKCFLKNMGFSSFALSAFGQGTGEYIVYSVSVPLEELQSWIEKLRQEPEVLEIREA